MNSRHLQCALALDYVPILNKRILWIDALKGFAIFCVTLGHCNPWPPLEKYIYSFHMFLFFFISGFLFSVKDSQKKMLLNCCIKLLIPFLVWNTISASIDYYHKRDILLFFQQFFVINGKLTSNPPIWFLLVLFITEITFILLKLYKRTRLSIATMLGCLVLWVLVGHKWVIWKLNLVPMALCFFVFGYIFKPFVKILGKLYVLIPLGIASLIFASLNVRIVYTYGFFGNYLYCIIAAFCGTLLMIGLFSSIEACSRLMFLVSWGKNSLIIMATQYFVFDGITSFSERFLGYNAMEYADTFISFTIALFVVIFINFVASGIKIISHNSKSLRIIVDAFGVR